MKSSKATLRLCLLCEKPNQLRNSHIIPKLFRRAIAKRLGRIPVWNNLGEPGKVAQDLPKHYLCCDECEQLMSAAEGKAAAMFQRGSPLPFRYGPWMMLFAAGLAAKAVGVHLRNLRASHAQDGIPPEEFSLLKVALAQWRKVILKAATPEKHELHLLNFDVTAFPGLNAACGHTLLWNDEFKAILIYLNGVLIVAVVTAAPGTLARATRITMNGATVTAACRALHPAIAAALQQLSDNYRAEQALEQA